MDIRTSRRDSAQLMSQPRARSPLVLESRSEHGPRAAGAGTHGERIGPVVPSFTTTTHSLEIRPGTVATPVRTIPIAMTADTIPTAMKPSTETSSIATVSRTFRAITFRTRTRGHITTTGPEGRQRSAASVDTPAGLVVDLAAGLQELTVLAAGAVCAPAGSAVSMVSAAAGSMAGDSF